MVSPTKFLQETYVELRQVVWPSRAEVLRLTLIGITISVATGLYIGVLYLACTKLMGLILKKTYGYNTINQTRLRNRRDRD